MPDDTTLRRHLIREGEWQRQGIALIAEQAGVTRSEAMALLREVASRLAGAVRVRELLRVGSNGFRIDQCAGLVRVTPSLELEIVPKFLSPADPSWREDFFLIATVAGARLLLRERLHISASGPRDLPSLIGAALVGAFRSNERRPIRTYHRRRLVEFALDGDLDPESLVLPEDEGFRQDVITFDRQNEFNAVVRAAVQTLLPEVSHPETRMQLMRVFERLSPQDRLQGPARRRVVPSRHRDWQPAYDLSVQVLRAFGALYATSGLPGPGFILHTWRTWQDLVAVAVSAGLPEYEVRSQSPIPFGTRYVATPSWSTARSRAATVTPDVAVHVLGSSGAALIIDAKYKLARGLLGDPRHPRVSHQDFYEVLAFLRAAKAQRAVLLYPCQNGATARAPGSVIPFERIAVEGMDVWGAEVEVRGIAAKGFLAFAQAVGDGLRNALAAARA